MWKSALLAEQGIGKLQERKRFMARRTGAKAGQGPSHISRAALLLCNIILIVGMIVAAVVYSRVITQQRNNLRKDAFCTTVESMKQVSENYFITEKGYVNNWSQYISSQHMTMDEALEFIRTINTQPDRVAHIVDMDDLSARSTNTRKENGWVHCYENWTKNDTLADAALLQKMHSMFNADRDDVQVLGKYRVGETQQTVVSVGIRVTIRQEDGSDKDYLLLRLIPVEYLQKSWVSHRPDRPDHPRGRVCHPIQRHALPQFFGFHPRL